MQSTIKDAVRLALALSLAAVTGHMELGYAQAAEPAPASAPAAAAGPTEEVIVLGRQRSSATDVIAERIEQDVPVDIVGAEQISRVGDSNVSLALRRLPGVTLVADQFIYVRGLGERYSSTTINGAYVPSPDLTRNVIPLDLFPAEIIDSLAVHKGYTADMPAAFGGGSVDIRTTGIPDDFVADFEIGSGWNSNSSDDAITYAGGDDDWQGKDDGTRAMPREISDAIQRFQGDLSPAGILTGLNRDGQPHSIIEAQGVNRLLATSLNRDIDFEQESPDPDYTLQASLGNSWRFGEQEDWRFGVIGLVDYKNVWRNLERINRDAANPENQSFLTQRTINDVALTGSLNLGFSYGDDQRVEATGLYLRNTEDEASLSIGNSVNFLRADGRQLRNYRIRYEERELELLQIRGSHTLGDDTLELLGSWLEFARELNFSWYYSTATAQSDIPSEILVSAEDVIDPASGSLISTSVRRSATSLDYRFTELEDEVDSGGWSLGMPFKFDNWSFTLSGGQDWYKKGRSYLQTQLGLGTTAAAALGALQGTPGAVFTDENILPRANEFLLSIGGIGTESYLAGERVDAAFLQFDVDLFERWRINGGVRKEDFKQLTVPVDQNQFDVNVPKIQIPADQLETLATDEEGYYPSLAVTYRIPDFWAEEFQLRLGGSETVARPDLREVSSATYIDPLTDARIRGNPDLEVSDLTNFDIRAEWFFGSGDNFTLSLFYKDIDKPIETVESAGTDDNVVLTFINADSAEVYGLEIEWLKSLGFLDEIGRWTDSFFVAGNVTLSDSEIVIGREATNLTNDTRRMTQQADYIANVQVGFDSPNQMHSAALVYNVVGDRVFFAGRDGAPDAIEQPFNSVDLVYSFYPTALFSVKFRVQNILDDKTEIERGDVVVLEQDRGVTFKLDAALKF